MIKLVIFLLLALHPMKDSMGQTITFLQIEGLLNQSLDIAEGTLLSKGYSFDKRVSLVKETVYYYSTSKIKDGYSERSISFTMKNGKISSIQIQTGVTSEYLRLKSEAKNAGYSFKFNTSNNGKTVLAYAHSTKRRCADFSSFVTKNLDGENVTGYIVLIYFPELK